MQQHTSAISRRAPVRRWRRSALLTAAVLLVLAGCGDDDGAGSRATPTASSAPPTATPSPAPTPTGPVLGGDPCADTDSCSSEHTALFAVAHSFTDPAGTILYRVTVPAWSTGTSWGDGINGFFFQASFAATGGGTQTNTYVPFNGIGAGTDGQPALPQFWFVVPAPSTATALTITACASSYAAADAGPTPACTTTLWSDTYSTLPAPSVGDPPFGSVDLGFAGSSSSQVTMPNNGVYPGIVTLEVSSNSGAPLNLSDADIAWLYNHLLFFDEVGDPYTNDLFADSDESHRSVGVLSLAEAAYPDPVAGTYHTKYGSTDAIQPVDAPDRQFFFYTHDILGTSAFPVGINYLYDQAADCRGYLNSQASNDTCGGALQRGQTAQASLGITPALDILPSSGQSGAFSASPEAQAGQQENRVINFGATSSALCSTATNPLAVNTATAYNQPNYVIDDTSGTWGLSFPRALYYVLPAGFGNCDAATTPFCQLTSSYAAYVPHYTDRNADGGTLNGGSTTAATVGGFALADQYGLGFAGSATSNSLVWFDNCGYGYRYEECATCQYALGTRKGLPSPPDDRKSSPYTIANQLTFPVVLGKECCASFYQENQSPEGQTTYEPPAQLDDGFGAFIPANGSLVYDTLFSDEAVVVYNATTGQRLFKLRLNAAAPAVYACTGTQWSATVSDTAPYAVTLTRGSAGALRCAPVGACPFGMTASVNGTTVTCTATEASFLLGMPDWSAELPTSAVQVRAWGAAGKQHDGTPGNGGFALTVLSPSDLAENLYAYIGSDGDGTVVIDRPLSSLTASAEQQTDPAPSGVMLIAGGGGDSGYAAAADPGTGGDGGVAIANDDSSGAAASAAGAEAICPDSCSGNTKGGNPSPFIGAGAGGGEEWPRRDGAREMGKDRKPHPAVELDRRPGRRGERRLVRGGRRRRLRRRRWIERADRSRRRRRRKLGGGEHGVRPERPDRGAELAQRKLGSGRARLHHELRHDRILRSMPAGHHQRKRSGRRGELRAGDLGSLRRRHLAPVVDRRRPDLGRPGDPADGVGRIGFQRIRHGAWGTGVRVGDTQRSARRFRNALRLCRRSGRSGN